MRAFGATVMRLYHCHPQNTPSVNHHPSINDIVHAACELICACFMFVSIMSNDIIIRSRFATCDDLLCFVRTPLGIVDAHTNTNTGSKSKTLRTYTERDNITRSPIAAYQSDHALFSIISQYLHNIDCV